MKKTWILGVLLALLFLCTQSIASPFTIVTGSYGSIPGGSLHNDLLGSNISANGWYGSQLSLDEASRVTFQFLGEEAGWNNWFQVDLNADNDWSDAATLFTNNSTPWLSWSSSYVFDDGIIPFRFVAQDGNKGYAVNGTNPDKPTLLPNFVITHFDTSFVLGNDSYLISHGITQLEAGTYLWFDDGGGLGPDDDNHDDMLIRVTAAPVPEPATMLLLGTGLIGLAGLGRKKFLKK